MTHFSFCQSFFTESGDHHAEILMCNFRKRCDASFVQLILPIFFPVGVFVQAVFLNHDGKVGDCEG